MQKLHVHLFQAQIWQFKNVVVQHVWLVHQLLEWYVFLLQDLGLKPVNI
jgi:hypothetical protein